MERFIVSQEKPMRPKRRFEVVDKIPKGFFVWGIGRIDGHEDYLPLAEIDRSKEKEGYTINTDTLKAIKLTRQEVEVLTDSAICGGSSLAEIHKKMKRYSGNERKKYLCEKYALVVPLLERLSE